MTAKVKLPAGYAPQFAIAFGAAEGDVASVDRNNPLPAELLVSSARSTALAASTGATGNTASFVPDLGRAIWVTLSGTWTGSVALQRSSDGGATWHGLTTGSGLARAAWTKNVNAPVAEETVAGALYRLSTTIGSGTLTYEVRQ